MNAKEIINHFNLKRHPEGGYFREVYRSKEVISQKNLPSCFNGDRNYATSIYFLLTSDSFSAFHKINQDEIWHFYEGSALHLHLISPKGEYSLIKIGSNYKDGENFQFTVPAQYYFAAEVVKKDAYSFVGCTVSPGFDFKDFVLPSYQNLVQTFPNLQDVIKKFTR